MEDRERVILRCSVSHGEVGKVAPMDWYWLKNETMGCTTHFSSVYFIPRKEIR